LPIALPPESMSTLALKALVPVNETSGSLNDTSGSYSSISIGLKNELYSRFKPAISAAFFAANAVSGAVATTSDSVAGRARACWPCGEHAGRACGEYAIEAANEAASIDPSRIHGRSFG